MYGEERVAKGGKRRYQQKRLRRSSQQVRERQRESGFQKVLMRKCIKDGE